MSLIVLDASVAVRLYVAHPDTAAAQRLAVESECISPGLVRLEMANALRRYVQAGIMSSVDAHRALAHVEQAVRVVSETPQMALSALEIALEHSDPVYDCCYLALALNERAALATADRKLAARAGKLGIPVVKLEPVQR